MKYARYALIFASKVIGKIIGIPVFYLLLPLRGYARNRVHNYVLQNDVYLPRLLDRDWRLGLDDAYRPHNKSYKLFALKDRAYIARRNVSRLEYLFALSIWVWFDDDSNYDTHDGKPEEETASSPFGTAWDLGDLRAQHPVVDRKKTWRWIVRNTFYNANYMFEEIREDDPNNFYHLTKRRYPIIRLERWRPRIEMTRFHFGYIPHSNSTRMGRMVWFTEDLDKIDTTDEGRDAQMEKEAAK